MLDLCKHLLLSQFEASLSTLAHAVSRCPDDLWQSPVAKYPFSQVAFHTLFFTDYYLGLNPADQLQQPYHHAHPELFQDYEQLQQREPVSIYERQQIQEYLQFCLDKSRAVIHAETEASLQVPVPFPLKNFSRGELHVYNTRHIQHHAAQLIMRLRISSGVDIPWMREGWLEPATSAPL